MVKQLSSHINTLRNSQRTTTTAINTIVATRAFTKFNDPRKFACHAGVAPFNYSSGTSIRSKWKVSHRANKKLKKLFHMAALSAIQAPGELKDYYTRKTNEGKNKMTVINAIRAKIIHRIFAVIRNNQEYDKNYINCLDLSIR
jgi:transposase